MKTIWVTGSKGQLGTEIRLQHMNTSDNNFIFTDIEELDLTSETEVTKFYAKNLPDLIINCAAYTAVDKAETDKENAFRINRHVPQLLARLADTNKATLLQISTDYVFDGRASRPYTESDSTNPQSVYGQSKLEGEQEVLKYKRNIVVRTSWLYSAYGSNFVKTMLRLGKEKDSVRVVDDQMGCPTYAADLADALLRMTDIICNSGKEYRGIYHYSNEGSCSWYEFATAIMEYARPNCRVLPIPTSDYPLPAHRPAYSIFDKTKIKNTFGLRIEHWAFGLEKCLKQILET